MNAFQHCSGLQHSENQIALASSALHATCDTFCHSGVKPLHEICACDILAQLQHANQWR